MIIYIENPNVCTAKILELISEFSKVSGYNINIQEFLVFLYINNELSENESEKNNSI